MGRNYKLISLKYDRFFSNNQFNYNIRHVIIWNNGLKLLYGHLNIYIFKIIIIGW